ncbi:helix-turn-helix transcriptional regulator [Xanthobacter pseudotagetidis]|uniref:helix-turn-helix transcriptional regulator n=1 Tax=Xanthobacter pseudotagetidis TaxID=3119911 RepID=UPI003726E6CD
MQEDKTSPDRLLKLQDVIFILSISRASLYAGIRVGLYPPPVKIGARAVRWRASDITALVEKGVGDA